MLAEEEKEEGIGRHIQASGGKLEAG